MVVSPLLSGSANPREGEALTGADLRFATFHLGSTRSGLVGSPIACEGSRTGFYTDDFDAQDFKPPEEIRKANLCGADLRGAWFGWATLISTSSTSGVPSSTCPRPSISAAAARS